MSLSIAIFIASFNAVKVKHMGEMITGVPRRLFFTALQWIAIAQGPKIQQKNKL
jgi:hypothetical protein